MKKKATIVAASLLGAVAFGTAAEAAPNANANPNSGKIKEIRTNAAKECKDERAADPELFAATYGSAQSKGKNAFGKCVSSKVKAAKADEPENAPTA